MVKAKPRPRVMMARDLADPDPDPAATLLAIAGICPQCDYAGTLHRHPDSTDVECGMCGWRTPYEESMPVSFDPEPGHPPVVYYMRQGSMVKIGTTVDLGKRVEALSPQGVLAVEFGSYELERQRHRQFLSCHSHGEWFHLGQELAAHIVDLRDAFGRAHGEPVDDWIVRWLSPAARHAQRGVHLR